MGCSQCVKVTWIDDSRTISKGFQNFLLLKRMCHTGLTFSQLYFYFLIYTDDTFLTLSSSSRNLLEFQSWREIIFWTGLTKTNSKQTFPKSLSFPLEYETAKMTVCSLYNVILKQLLQYLSSDFLVSLLYRLKPHIWPAHSSCVQETQSRGFCLL